MRLQACAKTCDFVYSQLTSIQDSLDGKNLESVLTEFGTRFHRQLFEHLQQFQYTSIGKHYLFYCFVSLGGNPACLLVRTTVGARKCCPWLFTGYVRPDVWYGGFRAQTRISRGVLGRNDPRDSSSHPHPSRNKYVFLPMLVSHAVGVSPHTCRLLCW